MQKFLKSLYSPIRKALFQLFKYAFSDGYVFPIACRLQLRREAKLFSFAPISIVVNISLLFALERK